MKLEIAFNQLHLETKAEELLFWGKITGLERDYYIAMTVDYTGNYQMAKKKYYWCLSSKLGNYQEYVFALLPETFKDHLVDCQKYNVYFKGNPDEILDKYLKDVDPDEVVDNKQPEEGGEKVEKDELQLLEEEEERAKNPIIEKRNFTGKNKKAYHILNKLSLHYVYLMLFFY